MRKIVRLDEQLENLAKKWYLSQFSKEDEDEYKRKFRNPENKKKIIEIYLTRNPKIAQKYSDIKKMKVKLALGLSIGTIGVATLAGTYILEKNKDTKLDLPKIRVEQVDNNEDKEKSEYKDFFDQIGEIKNIENRDDFIHAKTKDIIIEAYNSQNPEKTITSDNLEILVLNEYVLVEKDKLGNKISVERVPQNEIVQTNENQELTRIGNIYVYKIDGETVATYDSNGQSIMDKSIKQEEPFFKNTVSMLEKSKELKDLYKYPSNEYSNEKGQKNYEQEASKLLKYKEVQLIESQEIEK